MAFKKTYVGLKNLTRIFDGNGGIVELPIFTTFISPSDLEELAEVPSFQTTDSHTDIAKNLKSPPTKDWQRPCNYNRIADIGNYFGTTSQQRLMPNPILVGETTNSYENTSRTADILVKQLLDSNGNGFQGVYEIEIINNGKPPLWILDGQHRTKGLASNPNTQNQKIPVVMLIKHPRYSMQFLAQIFTEVTTGAADLEEIHKNWMEYSFGMKNYSKGTGQGQSSPFDKAMETIIFLTTEGQIDGTSNNFFDKIKFNPYDSSVVGAYNYNWNSKEWVDEIANHYYKNLGSLSPSDLAKQIIRFLRAAEELDSHKNIGSRLFGSKKNEAFKVLLNHMMWQFLENLDNLGIKTKDEWEGFLRYHDFHKSDWRLTWANGSQSGKWGRYANRASAFVWKNIFSNQKFSITPDIVLRGPAEITIHAFPKTAGGKPSNKNAAKEAFPSGSININGGINPWTVGANRMIINFSVPITGVGSIVEGYYKDSAGSTGIIGAIASDIKTTFLDLSKLKSPVDIEIWTCCFNEATKKKLDLTIQW